MRNHHPAVRRSIAPAVLVAACLQAITSAAGAQSTHPWRIETSIGSFADPYDISPDGDRTGILAALSVSRGFAPNFRGIVSLAGARVGDVARFSTPGGYEFRHDWMLLTAGPQVDLAVSRVRLSVALQAGGAWSRAVSTGVTPPPELGGADGSWGFYGVLVPTLQLRLPVTPRFSVTGDASAYFINWPDRPRSAPSFGVGLAFQP